jgi:hypothetical protein
MVLDRCELFEAVDRQDLDQPDDGDLSTADVDLDGGGDGTDQVEEPRPPRISRSRRRREETPPDCVAAIALGWIVGLAGLGLTIAGIAAPAAMMPIFERLSAAHLTPPDLLVLGGVLGALGMLRRQFAGAANRPDDDDGRLAHIERCVDFLTEQTGAHSGSGSGSGDLHQVLVALQRQDEKINNLTRATKMYGKPLIDISTQVSELVSKSVEIENESRAVRELSEGLTKALGTTEANLLVAIESAQSTAEPVTTQLADLLLTTRRIGTQLQELQERLYDDLTHRFEETRRHVADAVQKLIDRPRAEPGADDVTPVLQSLHREVAAIATTLARLANAPAPTRSAAPATTAHASPTPSSGPPAGEAPTGLAQSIAGERQASGKNVLGAIQKLKKLRN